MLNLENIVDGKQLKNLPLKVCYYARSQGGKDSLVSRISHIEDYITNQTDWTITACYVDYCKSGLYLTDSSQFMDLIQDIMPCPDCKECEASRVDAFNLIVVDNFGQISTDVELTKFYLEQGFPTFSIEQEILISNNCSTIVEELIDKGIQREEELDLGEKYEEGDRVNIRDCYIKEYDNANEE